MNLLRVDDTDYLVAARGITDWVRNLRVAGEGTLTVGRRTTAFTATEVPLAERPTILRPYLKRWAFEVGQFFDGVDAAATDEELLAIADRHPVFQVTPREPTDPAD